jgi:hypothetical protein
MTPEETLPLKQKLQNLRQVLWLCFAGASVSVALMMVIANAFLVSRDPDIVSSTGRDALIPMLLLGAGFLLVVVAIGAGCLVVYYVIKRRLERDDGIFL